MNELWEVFVSTPYSFMQVFILKSCVTWLCVMWIIKVLYKKLVYKSSVTLLCGVAHEFYFKNFHNEQILLNKLFLKN